MASFCYFCNKEGWGWEMKNFLIFLVIILGFNNFVLAGNKIDLNDFKKQCNNGDGDSCSRLASLFYGNFGFQDYNKAFIYSKKSCEFNSAAGCMAFADAFNFGLGSTKKDLSKAIKYYKKSCDLGSGTGCALAGANIGILNQNFFKAFKYYEKGCDLKDEISCMAYKTIKQLQ